MMPEQDITAADMARDAGIIAKKFRDALRKEQFPWHRLDERRTVSRGSSQHDEMRRVLEDVTKTKTSRNA